MVENGRPLYGLRVLNQQIEDTKALNEMNQKILLDSQQFVEKLEGVKAEND